MNTYLQFIKERLFILGVLIVFLFGVGWVTVTSYKTNISTENAVNVPHVGSFKKEFKYEIPHGMLQDIPIESTSTLQQSYEIAYEKQTQSTFVALSKKTREENLLLYKDFLFKEGFVGLKSYNKGNISSLYATKKDGEAVNVTLVTISTSTVKESYKTSVSVSYLK